MATPSPEGTTLTLTPVGGGSAITVGCVQSIRLNREARTTEPDIITATSGASAWSGVIVTSKTLSIDVQGLVKAGGAPTQVQVGGVYTATLQFGTDVTITLTDLEFVCTRNNIEASGTNPVTFDMSFTVNVGAYC